MQKQNFSRFPGTFDPRNNTWSPFHTTGRVGVKKMAVGLACRAAG